MRSYRALFLFAGLGGGALGFARAQSTFRGVGGRFEIAGAVDFDAAAARDFEALTGSPCTVGDRGGYRDDGIDVPAIERRRRFDL